MTRFLLLLSLAACSLPADARGPFEGQFLWAQVTNRGELDEYTSSQSFTLRQKGTYVCGEWSTESGDTGQSRQGLVAGRVKGGVLYAKLCGNPQDGAEDQCIEPLPSGKSSEVTLFTTSGATLNLIEGESALLKHRRINRTPGTWSFADPIPSFLLRCAQR